MMQSPIHKHTDASFLAVAVRLVEEVFARYPVDSEGHTVEEVLTLAAAYTAFDEQMAFLLKHVIYVDELSEFTLMDYTIPHHIIEAASVMKRFPKDTYVDYVEDVLSNPLATRIMMRYWTHFSFIGHYDFPIADAHIRRTIVYKRALELAESKLRYRIFNANSPESTN